MDFHDPFSALSHLVGALWWVYATGLLFKLTRGTSRRFRATVAFYSVSVVALYAASGLFHSVAHADQESLSYRVWQRLDMSAIYALIVGSCLPLIEVYMRKPWATRFQVSMLTIGGVGVVIVWLAPKPPYVLTVALYLSISLLAASSVPMFARALGWSGFIPFGQMCVAYVSGAVCEMLDWPTLWPGLIRPHDVFHIMILLGSLFHFRWLMGWAVPRAHEQARERRGENRRLRPPAVVL